jgi:hypothetical protein
MNKSNILSILVLLLIIILMCSFSQNTYREYFVPKKIKEFYRPIARNARITYEGFYDKSSLDISNIFRRFQII